MFLNKNNSSDSLNIKNFWIYQILLNTVEWIPLFLLIDTFLVLAQDSYLKRRQPLAALQKSLVELRERVSQYEEMD